MKTAERKQQLIAEGALHRTATVIARESLRAQLRPAALVRDAAPGLAAGALSAWLGSGSAMAVAGKLLPLVLTGLGALKGSKGKRGTAVTLAAAGIAVGAAWVLFRRKRH